MKEVKKNGEIIWSMRLNVPTIEDNIKLEKCKFL